jgi:Domain of unknown function (DUF4410)
MKRSSFRLLQAEFAALACLAFLLTGCAKATISPEEPPSAVGVIQRPSKIVVYDFAVSADNVTQNASALQKLYRAVAESDEQIEAEKAATGREAAHDLSEDLVKQLKALGFDAETLPRGTPAGEGDLIVDGQFLKADEGNRARRMIIGLGAGASHLETLVTVSHVSSGGTTAELLRFKTQSDSGKMPGAALTMGAGAAAQGGAAAASAGTAVTSAGKVYNSMLSTLAEKTSKQIAAYLSQYFASQKWISPDRVQSAAVAE